ncbi:NACHT domain-containing protein [Streptomyces sp. NPDC053367]|uniref:NACHT domain-containing protein n=1 Tax=Streptomyces sp. NPDC053367 TaxID=3365700 RepID=UPI0037D6A6EF
MNRTAVAAFRRMEGLYAPRSPEVSRSVQESLSALDFEARFLALLAVSTVRASGLPHVSVGRSPGLGEWISLLRDLRSRLGDTEAGSPGQRVAQAITAALARYDQGIPEAPPELRATKNLRDHVSHGGAIPDGLSPVVDALVQAISDIIAECLSDARLTVSDGGGQELRPVVTWGDTDVPLWPFMYAQPDDSWCVYARYTGSRPEYLAFGAANFRARPEDAELVACLDMLLRAKREPDDPRELFRAEVENDLKAFADVVGSPPQYFDHSHGFGYEWGKSVSEGTQLRRDYFRVGPDGPEWQDEQTWVPYRTYLRKLTNWPIVASRLRHKLEEMERQLAQEETDQLGWQPDVGSHREAHVEVTEYDGGNLQRKSFSQLIDDVDADLGVETGQTQVFFVNGEAGIGKTRAMVKAALNRAREVERDQGDKPLFLYVKSTGRVLDDLDAAVNHAVALTQNLTAERVKVLCGKGLIALLIDGFDELLGGAAYSDAIDSLQDWLNALGGRGVLVVSARSSYYMNQYRSSVQRASKAISASVRHSIAQVLRWNPAEIVSFLNDYGVPAARFERLPTGDRELLGLPFFARAFAEMCRSGAYEESDAEGPSFTERLLNHYLAREERKLAYQTDSASGLLNRDELRRTFEHVAEIMVDGREREIDSSDLEFAAATALDIDDLDDREGLRERLQVLCGLATDSATRGPTRFRFQHEVFFDNFLAGIVARHLRAGRHAAFQRLLSRSEWRTGTVSGVVAGVDTELLVGALADVRLPAVQSSAASRDTVATNLGAMWAEVISRTAEMPDRPIVDATFTGPLDLSHIRVSKSCLVDCRLESLTLPTGSGWVLELERTRVKKITAGAEQADLSGLRGVHHGDLVELLFRPSRFFYRRPEILEALRARGVGIVDAPGKAGAVVPARVEAARHYLKNLVEYASSTLILKDNYQPDDHRLKWTQEYPDEWKPFVDRLTKAKLARPEKFSAKGSRKIKLRLQFGAANILDEGSDVPPIQEFWTAVKG